MAEIAKEIIKRYPTIEEDCVILGWRGSVAHGTYVETATHDDKDLMGVVIPDKFHYLGLAAFGSKSTGTKEIMEGPWDVVCYELKKMFRLLIKGNPNVLALLWLPENLYLKVTEAGKMLIEGRNVFATKAVYHSFVGYARGQMHRMESGKSTRDLGAKRKELVEKFGFDSKNAAHLIRLVRMCIEFLTDGDLKVQRGDASELIDIKTGKWSLEEVKKEAQRLFNLADEAFIRSSLPAKVDMEAANSLCYNVLCTHFNCSSESFARSLD